VISGTIIVEPLRDAVYKYMVLGAIIIIVQRSRKHVVFCRLGEKSKSRVRIFFSFVNFVSEFEACRTIIIITRTHTYVVRRAVVTSVAVTVVRADELRRVGNTVYRTGNNCADTNKPPPPSINRTKTSTPASFACYGDVTRSAAFRAGLIIHIYMYKRCVYRALSKTRPFDL